MPRGASSSLSVSEQTRAVLIDLFSPDREAKSDISQVCVREEREVNYFILTPITLYSS